jgi:hypothetical protein
VHEINTQRENFRTIYYSPFVGILSLDYLYYYEFAESRPQVFMPVRDVAGCYSTLHIGVIARAFSHFKIVE